MVKFFKSHIKYPEKARKKGVQGVVKVKFTIDRDGNVTNPAIEEGIGNGCDEEALRVINLMPDWQPAKVNGNAVDMEILLPVQFKLDDYKNYNGVI